MTVNRFQLNRMNRGIKWKEMISLLPRRILWKKMNVI